jgi:iron complex outermembrane receptor protein
MKSLLLLALGAWLPQGLRAQQPADASLHGAVLDSASHAPIAGATVSLPGLQRTTVTDRAGQYGFDRLPRDTVMVTVRFIGFAERTVRADLTRGGMRLDLTLAQRAIELEAITVSGQRSDTAALHNEQAIAVMTPEQVQSDRGQTVGETIKELPGVAVIQYGPNVAKPVVRGLSSQRIRVMNGDVPQEGQQWGAEHAPEIDAFAANEIEVVRGGGTVLYGSDALGGVVRVLPRPLPTSGAVGGAVDANVFSNNRQGAGSLMLEGSGLRLPLIGPLAWRAQGSYRRAGDARAADYYLPNTGFEEKNGNAALGIRRSWGSSELSYSHYSTDIAMYLGAGVATQADFQRAIQFPATSEDFTYTIGRPRQSVSHDLVSWRTDVILPAKARLSVNYSYQYNNRNEFDGIGFASGSTVPAFGLRLITHTVDARISHAPIGHLSGAFGVSGMRQGNLSRGRSFLIPQYRLYSGGVYGLEQLTFDRWQFTAGLRYDYRWQHAYQYGSPVIISPEDRRSWNGLTGSFGTVYQLGKAWSLAGTVGTGWRAPNVSELFSAGVHQGAAQYELGDSSLGRERSYNVDATLRHVSQALHLEVSTYQNRIDGFLFLRPTGVVSTVRGTYAGYQYSATDARLRGIEASFLLSPSAWWSFYASGTLLRGVDRNSGEPLYDMPADRVVANLRLYGGQSRRFRDPYVEFGTTLVRQQDHVPSILPFPLPTDGYALFNVEVGVRQLLIGGQPFTASLAVQNVFNAAYRDYLSRYRLFVDDPGRDFVLRLRVPFGTTGER